jgi:hypothetical protein
MWKLQARTGLEAAIGGDAVGTTVVGISFEDRFARLRPRLMAVCTAVIGPDDAADLVQETYIRASERLHQLRDPALLDAWVVRIALNEAKSILRRRQTERRVLAPPAPPGSPDVALRELVQNLEPRERAVIVLHTRTATGSARSQGCSAFPPSTPGRSPTGHAGRSAPSSRRVTDDDARRIRARAPAVARFA